MKSIKRILVPTDFSDGSDKAIAFAMRLALSNKGEIDLVHIVPEMQNYIRFMSSEASMELSRELIDNAEKRIEGSMSNIPEEVRGEFFIKTDRKPAESILHHAKNRSYDLIIIGAKGEHKSKMRRGGVTLQVIRNSKIPVLTVDEDTALNAIKSILVPTDGSDLSFTAFEKAGQLAAAIGGELTLYYVVEMRGGLSDSVLLMPTEINKEHLYSALISKLEKFLKARINAGITFTKGEQKFMDSIKVDLENEVKDVALRTEITTGFSPNFEIETYARKNSDLVVMATHGHTGFASLMLGSVTEKVVQHLNKPVLTVRPSESDFEHWKEIAKEKSSDLSL